MTLSKTELTNLQILSGGTEIHEKHYVTAEWCNSPLYISDSEEDCTDFIRGFMKGRKGKRTYPYRQGLGMRRSMELESRLGLINIINH